MTKRCRVCGEDKPLDELVRNPLGSHGRASLCRLCQRAVNREYYLRKREKLKQDARAYRASHTDEIARQRRARREDPDVRERERAANAAWREANRERKNAGTRAWTEANPEKVKAAHAAWYAANKARTRANARAWEARNPDKMRVKRRRDNLTRRARIRGRFIEHVDADVCYRMHGGRCGICGEFIDLTGSKFDVDHVIPLSRGGAHGYVNTQPAHPSCNRAKRDRLDYVPKGASKHARLEK